MLTIRDKFGLCDILARDATAAVNPIAEMVEQVIQLIA